MKAEIRALYEKVQAKKTEILSAEKGNYQTDGYFRFSSTGQVIDIKTVRSTDQLCDVTAFLIEREKSHEEAAKFLGVESKTTWLSAPINSWMNDLKLRATQLNIAAEKANLEGMENTLLTISPQLLKELQLEAVKKALS